MPLLMTVQTFAEIELKLTNRTDIVQLASILTEAADHESLCTELEQLKDRLNEFLDGN